LLLAIVDVLLIAADGVVGDGAPTALAVFAAAVDAAPGCGVVVVCDAVDVLDIDVVVTVNVGCVISAVTAVCANGFLLKLCKSARRRKDLWIERRNRRKQQRRLCQRTIEQ
jgi:hypothetical protein